MMEWEEEKWREKELSRCVVAVLNGVVVGVEVKRRRGIR